MIHILGTGKSARMLQGELDCTRSLHRLPNGKKTLIVNWGRVADFSRYPNVINRRIFGNKYTELRKLSVNKLTPEVYVLNEDRYPDVDIKVKWPILGRNTHHTRGNDIVYINNINDYDDLLDTLYYTEFYVQYIPKKKEYRVHIFKDKCLGIARKLHENPDHDVTKDIVWSYDNGYRHCFIDEKCPQLEELGRKAIDALELDFGAVDIILGMDGKYYVLEVNTAPGLIEDRVILYANEIRKWEKLCQ